MTGIGDAGTVEDVLGERPMRPLQITVVAICILLNLIDGFDVLALTFTAPTIATAWGLDAQQLGVLLSAGFAGMAVGALFLSPLADRYGRRRAILGCVSIVATGMTLSALAASAQGLMLARFLTGVGVGPLISSTTAMVHEFSSVRRRGLGMGLMAVAFPAGATVGGAVALTMVDAFGWRSVFATGAAMTMLALPIVWFAMPESLSFLLASAEPRRRAQARALLASLALPESALRIPRGEVLVARPAVQDPNLRWRLSRLSALFFLTMAPFYFVQAWLPKLLVQSGATAGIGARAAIALNLAGMVGGVVAGAAMARIGEGRTARAALLAMGLSIAAIGFVPATGSYVLINSAVLGLSLFATMAAIYTLLSTGFPADCRATAIGIASTVGRVGSTLGPLLAGGLLAHGNSVVMVCGVMAFSCLAAALLASDRLPGVCRNAHMSAQAFE